MKKTLAVPLAGIPVLLFLVSRMTSFFDAVWGLGFALPVWYAVVVSGVLLLFLLRKKIYSYLEDSAYGFSGIALTIYILSILVCVKYSSVVHNGCAWKTSVGTVGGGILLGLFALLFMKGSDSLLQKLRKPGKSGFVFFACAVLLLNLQAVLYCTFMKEIFVWDNAGYFVTVHRLNSLFPSGEYFRAVYESVFETDYNYIIALPASIFCKLFGESRLVFVLSIVNMYVLPLVMLIYAVSKRFFEKGWYAVAAVLGLPYIVFAANTGFIDIGGVVFALAAVVLFLYGDGKEMSLLTGICLAVCVFMRRWYSFFALSFVITAVLYCISHKNIKSVLYTIAGFAFVLLFFAQPFVSGKLMADYHDMYSAYALGIGTDVRIFTRYFGWVLTVSLSMWAVWKQVKLRLRMTAEFFVWIQAVICFALFVSLQTHGQQHLALYLPAFIILILSICAKWGRTIFCTFFRRQGEACRENRPLVTGIGRIVPVTLCSVCLVSVFLPREQPRAIGEIKRAAAFPTFSVYPPVDENAESFLQVTEYMDGEIGLKGKTVCFLASSIEMNYDTLRNAEISLSVKKKYDIDRKKYYLAISDVDKRDGLSDSLFTADYILVPSALQIHLAPEEQKVISVPYEQITSGMGIGVAYEKQDKSFEFPSGDEIYVYKKIREVTDAEKEELKNIIFA